MNYQETREPPRTQLQSKPLMLSSLGYHFVQVDGEPWIQPAGDIVVLKSALKESFERFSSPLQFSCVYIHTYGIYTHVYEFIHVRVYTYRCMYTYPHFDFSLACSTLFLQTNQATN